MSNEEISNKITVRVNNTEATSNKIIVRVNQEDSPTIIYANDPRYWYNLSKAWAIQMGSKVKGEDYSSKQYSEYSKIWAEGTDEEVEALGGEHSAKQWSLTVEGRLSNQIEVHNTDTSAHQYIQNLIRTEATTRENVDASLQRMIDDEKTARKNVDTELQQNINAEAQVRQQNDIILQQHIDAEAQVRQQADTSLSNSISAEAIAREQADASLSNSISSINNIIPTGASTSNKLVDEQSLAEDLATKVDRTSAADKVYGTDTQGNQTTYDKNSFGQVDDVTVGDISVVINKVAVLGSMAGEAASDYSTTNEANNLYAAKSLESTVSTIETKIPSQASSSNQLADKSFVNSSIATNTANFIGTFNSVAELEAYTGTLTNNDYAFVVDTDSAGNTVYDRYKYNADEQEWLFEYELNNSSFTADQWASINSGITSGGVALINTALQPNDDISKLNNNVGYTSNIGTVTSVNSISPDANGNVSITIPSMNSTNNYVPYRSGTSSFGNSTLMYNSNAMAFTGKLHIGSSSPANYYDKGRLTIYDNTASQQTTSLALLNYGGGGGCGVAVDMYNTSANGGIPSGRFGVVDNGNYSGYLQLQVKKSGGPNNPLLPAMNIVPVPASNSLTTCLSFGQDEFNRVLFDLHKPEAVATITDSDKRWSGSGTTYYVSGNNKFNLRLLVAVGDIVSFDSFATEATVIAVVSNSSTLQITTDQTLGTVSNASIAVKKAYFKVTDESYNTKAVIDPYGKFGIGKLKPNYELDVVGTINASTDIKINGSSLATVAKTGDYDDLTNKPSVPSITFYWGE